MRLAPLVVAASLALVSCGTTSTKTITKVAPTRSPASATTPTASTATTPATTAGAVYFKGVAGDPMQRPASLQLTVDGTLFVGGVQWVSWGGPEAMGSGNAEYHGCTPSCAQATPHTALVSIRLFGIRTCSGRQYYSGVTLTTNSGRLLDQQFLQRSWSPC
jgi:hypothetical protein